METARQFLSRRWKERRAHVIPFTPGQAFDLDIPETFENPFVAFPEFNTPQTEEQHASLDQGSVR